MQGKAGVIIENVVGCGKFQVLISILVYFLANSSVSFSMFFMAFGTYNPGWRCNDHLNSSDSLGLSGDNLSAVDGLRYKKIDVEISRTQSEPKNASENSSIALARKPFEYSMEGNCPLFESCKQIEFDPSSITIVSEWGLLCSKRWIPSILMSIQMAGILLGSFLSGYIGDAFGRKPTIYAAVLSLAVLNVISIFSWSWEMLVVLRFFVGTIMALVVNLYYVFTAEFVPEKWRSVLQGIPAWSFSKMLFTLSCLGLRNWRHILIVTASVGVLGFIPVFWVPESLRWLEAKNKSKSFKRAVEKIARMNGKTFPALENVEEIAISSKQHDKRDAQQKRYNVIHLFKNGYAKYTILLSIPWFSSTAVNYALSIGVNVLHGDFYTNLVISGVITIPFSVFHIFLPNLLGRKKTGLIFSGLSVFCLFGAGAMEFFVSSESAKSIGIPALIFTAKVCMDGIWCVQAIFSMELYPTVIRGLGMSWGSTMARVGGVISPFLIPSTSAGTSVSYTGMAAVMVSCFIVYLFLPETKGQLLKDTYSKRQTPTSDNMNHVHVEGPNDQDLDL